MRAIVVMLLSSLSLQAQPKKEALWAPPKDDQQYRKVVREPKDGKLTIPMTLHPMGVKIPLSRFYLTPQYSEMKPGNRVPTFMRAYMEQDNFYTRELREKRDILGDLVLEDLVAQIKGNRELGSAMIIGGLAYRKLDGDQLFYTRGRPLGDVDEGARQLTADWQIWFNIREDGIGTLLPEVQKMREHATLLKIRMRYELGTGDFEKAAYTARTFYGLASSFETHPTLIGLLVGIAIQSICLDAVEEMIQQPNCPNLYWSLTEIPAHVLDSRQAHGGERILSDTMFKPFTDATGPMPESEIYRLMKLYDVAGSMTEVMNTSGVSRLKYNLDAPIRSTDAKKVAAARKLLVDTGMKADHVKSFSDLQAIVTADIRKYELLLDEVLITGSLPFPDAMKAGEAAEKRLKDEGGPIAQFFIPTNRKVVAALARIQQRVAYLRVVEAVRLYAHEHGGRLPAKLADCTVPIPLDPTTLKPFDYTVRDGVAMLSGGVASYQPVDPRANRHYEIRVKK
ncbi:MAG: hypothetical protein JNK93_00065 [Planctomycetia bacterium]|nr:hypothetical protein [Planctomycetia bacterium]